MIILCFDSWSIDTFLKWKADSWDRTLVYKEELAPWFIKGDHHFEFGRVGDINYAAQHWGAIRLGVTHVVNTGCRSENRRGDDSRHGNTSKMKPWYKWKAVHLKEMNRSNSSSTDLATFSTKLIFIENYWNSFYQTYSRRWSTSVDLLWC